MTIFKMTKQAMTLYVTMVSSIVLIFGCKREPNQTTSIKKKPNIVLILTDDQGWGDLSFNGNENLNTPHIDRIAKNGVSFENFYVQPVCSPTRAELLTGRHYTRLGVYSTSEGGERINLEETTLADILKKEGYQTAAYGKWHNGMQAPYHPNARGFDDFYGFASGHWGNYFSPMLEHNGKIVEGQGFLVDDLTNKGLDFISKNRDQPFFLYLPYNTPHSPMQVPDQYWNKFENKTLPTSFRSSKEEDVNFTKAALAMVENIDHNVGRVLQQLKNLQLEENTIVIFLSDNGPNNWRWNGGMKGKKGAVDEGGVRTPFFMQWKNTLPAGKIVNEIASAIDILPTVTDLIASKNTTAKPVDGKSLKPLLLETDAEWTLRLIYNHWSGKTSVRSQKYRLDPDDQLFNIEKDRAQTKDISSSFPNIRDSLILLKKQWLKETNANQEITDNRYFTLGDPEFEYTHIPARDGTPHGNIRRSNRWPNDSYFTNWTSEKDSISWDVNVIADGEFEVDLYYTLASENVGVSITLQNGQNKLDAELTKAHNPAPFGMENDRIERAESYVKDFKKTTLGEISLKEGKRSLILKASHIRGTAAMDVRLLVFRRL